MNKINEMNPLLKIRQVCDAKDFIIYVLEQIHKELKKPINLIYSFKLLKVYTIYC